MLSQFDLTDATARLIASDWLEEQGRCDEAKLLRGKGPIRLDDNETVVPNWDKESIRTLLANNPLAVYRALEVLFERQTYDEQQAENTKHQNGRGFNARDAQFGSQLAEQVIAWRKGESKYRYPMSINQLNAARNMLRKYAGQLARVANGTEEVAVV